MFDYDEQKYFNNEIILIYGNRDFTYQSLESATVSHIERTTKRVLHVCEVSVHSESVFNIV